MPDPARPFVRVYHDDLMRDYPEVYADDAALATWLRLLVIADRMWPTPPELPKSARGRGMTMLVEAGLVEQPTKHQYRIRGYETERTMRQQSARNAAALRWHSERDAVRRPNPSTNPNPISSTKEDVLNAHERTTTKRGGGLEAIAEILPRTLR